jgi:serine/threonine-protein kinase
MADDTRVQQLLDEVFASGRTPEAVCGDCPELLPEVRRRCEQMRRVEAQLDALFPTPLAGPADTPAEGGQAADFPQVPGYEVEAVLGRGGQGVVFRARHLPLNRSVALKMVLAGAYAGPREKERFQREAEAVARLRHPNVVQVYDVGEAAGQPYFTMELVDGSNLAATLANTPQPPLQAAQLMVTLAGAVQAAHASGVVHRDLKPANVLLTSDGTPKIGDFGLARWHNDGGGLTQTGAALGTPTYMAPEQARGRSSAVGPAADVYALGTILYEMLTGRPPFRAETAAATLQQVLAEDPIPPSRLIPRVPRDLETICLKCLQKDPGKRYATAGDLGADIERFLRHEPIQARPPGRLERCLRWVRRRPATAALLSAVGLLVASGAVGAWSLYQQRAAAHARQALTNQEIRGILERTRGPLEEGWHAVDLARIRQAVSEANRAVNVAHTGGASASVEQDAEAFLQVAGGRLERARNNRTLLDAVLDVSVSSEIPRYATERVDRILAHAQPSADEQYAAAFLRWGLDVDRVPEDEVVARLRQEPDAVIQELIAGLDAWMLERRAIRRPDAEWRRLFRVADQLDHGDRSRRLRGLLADASPRQAANAAGLGQMRKDINPRTEPVLTVVLLSEACALAGDALGAEEVLRRAVTARPEQVVLLNALARRLDRPQRSRLDEAIGYYRAARGQRRSLGIGLSMALTRAGRPAQAEEVLQELASQQPANLAAHFFLGGSLSAQEKYGEAAAAYRKAIDLKPDFAEAYSNLGRALDELRKYDDAAAALRKAIDLKPDLVSAHVNLGVAPQGQKNYREAEAAYRKAIDLQPDLVKAHNNLGNALNRQGRRDEAAAAFRRAIALKPDFVLAHINLGGALFERGNYGEAEAAFRTAVRLRPDSVRAHFNLGNALREQRKYGDAEKAYRTVIGLQPDLAEAYANLGVVLDVLGKHGDAEAACRKAIGLQPDLAEAYFNLGSGLMRRAQFGEAVTLLTKCAALVPRGTPRHVESQRRLRLCERYMSLDAKLPAVLSGTEKPANAAEQIEFARLCLFRKLYAAAARCFAGAFAADPQLAADFRAGHRYDAACAATLAGCDPGEDVADRAGWRAQARQWLRADLASWTKSMDGNAQAGEQARRALAHWPGDPDLAGLREPAELDKLSADERADCLKLWAEVATVLARTKK